MEEFEAIYRQHHKRVYFFIFRLCGDHQLAEELTQETFYQAFSGFHRFKGNCEVFTWLAAIAKHIYYKYLRDNKLGDEAISLDTVSEAYCAALPGSPEEDVIKDTVTNALRRIIGNIPQKYRDVVILRIYGELPFSQVAKALGITESSAKVLYFRAKKMLMEELHNEFDM